MYYKQSGRHHFLHTRFTKTRSEESLAEDQTYQEKHWLLTVNGVKERAVSTGYANDSFVWRLAKKHVPGLTEMVFLYECKPLTFRESVAIWQTRVQLAMAEK